MNPPIDVIGIGADGPASLRPELIERIHAAEFLAGGQRQLNFFPDATSQRFVIKDNVLELIKELSDRWPTQRCAVLASGDPMFYGIGVLSVGVLGRDNCRIEPALSSMQLAFARAGLPWERAILASVHGRPLRPTLLPLLGKRLIGLFTQDGDGPSAVARFIRHYDLTGYEAIIGENLGTKDERVTRCADLNELACHRYSALNYLILNRCAYPTAGQQTERNRKLVPGVPDEAFARPEVGREVMTRQEVRAVVLGKLGGELQPGDTIWDIGAGLGTVSVELAVLRPHVEVVAVERDPERIAFLRQNRERFDAYNIRVIEGTAPAALEAETERPRRVFLGGSGDRLADILELIHQRLQEGGRLVANFVTLEHLTLALGRFKEWGWPVEVTEMHVSRSDALAGLTGLKPQRGVFIVAADKPGALPQATAT